MQKKDLALLIALLMLTGISVASLYYRSIILEDFTIMDNDKDAFELLEGESSE